VLVVHGGLRNRTCVENPALMSWFLELTQN
jgi:hypothetical protein